MDSKELIVVEFGKTVQTAPYESETSKVSLTVSVEAGDTQKAIRERLDMVKAEVFTALNMGDVPSAVQPKRGPGRPPKVKPAEEQAKPSTDLDAEPAGNGPKSDVQKIAEASKPAEEPKPEPTADDFADPAPAEVKPIEDKALQEECAKAAKIITPEKVKNLFQTKYGATRVSLVKQEERQKFLDDLAGLVKKAQADAKTV